jgi:hypothetical protein
MTESGSLTFLEKIKLIPDSILAIWKNFLFGPNGKGRPKGAVACFVALAVITMASAFSQYGSINNTIAKYFFWSMFATALFGWVLGLPAFVFLVDNRKKKMPNLNFPNVSIFKPKR